MQLFLPSLLSILVIALFAFAVVPQFGALSLAVVSLLALIATVVHHYYMFKDEYAASTWQNMIASYSGYIALGVALVISILFLMQMRGYLMGGSSSNAAANGAVAAANAGILAGAASSLGAMVNSVTGPPAATAGGEAPTILEQATTAAQQSLAAMPNIKEAAQQITNPLVAAVNRGLNAVAGNTKPPAAQALPFSPSEV